MSAASDMELAKADARYLRERISLLRARLYRRGESSTPQLVELERRLVGAEHRLRELRARAEQ
jgi:hypothetical protein